ncbi:MAG TPA: ABC transporter ATP-binding protein [Gammaproteobacteria bacterium]|nr:ABC transporter ATP-binding protein [Gammaproteobacteria bacterium]
MLELDQVQAHAGRFALAPVSLSVEEGRCHAVLGPSGSGKSTLLKAVLGALPVTAGEVRLGGETITRWPMERRRLGYVPQHLGLFPHLSVRDNLHYSARARRIPPQRFRPLLDRLVEITAIGGLLERPVTTLSGGERQRVALVRALAAAPRTVLLDEPFTALDEALRHELWWLLRELQQEQGLSALLVTHDLSEAHFLAEHITVLIDGRPEQSAPREQVRHRPATLAVARFLGLRNLFPAEVRETRDGELLADCPDLCRALRLPGRARPGDRIWIGIHPDDVMLRDANHPPRPDECVVEGRVRLQDMGGHVLIRLEPPERAPVELIANHRALRRFGIVDGGANVAVGLPAEALFWVPDEDPGRVS